MKSPLRKGNASTSPPTPSKEEPEITQEESIPSDGRDEVGEDMMKELGRERVERKKGPGANKPATS